MQILGLAPGREVGAAYKYLLAYRMEHGSVSAQEAETVLREWWKTWQNK